MGENLQVRTRFEQSEYPGEVGSGF
uniref:Uncharacterized protein n=1 Tax=Arundo donax TaxID=35708 RepID=A0A0A8XXW5_ARUDO